MIRNDGKNTISTTLTSEAPMTKTSTLTINNVGPADTGYYECRVRVDNQREPIRFELQSEQGDKGINFGKIKKILYIICIVTLKFKLKIISQKFIYFLNNNFLTHYHITYLIIRWCHSTSIWTARLNTYNNLVFVIIINYYCSIL